ncbi:MAG: acyl-CoA dehydrogenase family protein [Alphaproteobacteria bacterium]|nr:acyl-CoA dehydrogenase family protein [Alphaproteobacteria bacterium]
MDFALSPKAEALLGRIQAFMAEHIEPVEAELLRRQRQLDDPWVELPEVTEMKARAREAGLWNLFLPSVSGLSNVDYATLAEQMGRSHLAPEVFNCNAPDTGNMEVLLKYGSQGQKDQWLDPLLDGRIRSVFLMTEPGVASSDATNMEATARLDGDEVVINGRKWWSTGAGHPDAKVGIFMGLTDESAPRHQQHSMVAVPLDAPGVKVERLLTAMGVYDEPIGHGEVTLTDVRLPAEAIIAGPGRAFEIAQGRLGPGRVHHCMRLIGLAEYALELACERSVRRVAFGKPIANLGGNRDIIANARVDIEMARLLTLKAAWLIDTVGVFGAMTEISAIKVVAPNVACRVIDQAIQVHGGAGLSEDLPLVGLYAGARVLRLADGPDEVHRGLIARWELAKYADRMARGKR